MIEEAQRLPLPPGNYRVDVERLFLGELDVWAIAAMFGYTMSSSEEASPRRKASSPRAWRSASPASTGRVASSARA